MKNKKIIAVVLAVVLVGAGFGGGYTYAKSKVPANAQFATFGAGGPGGQIAFSGGKGNLRINGGGFTTGEIISKDANGITIKMQDGSTKIVLIGSSAQITKSAEGSATDLTVGTNVTVMGSANSDGSLTAQNVQIRPAGMGFGSTTRQIIQ